MSLFWAARRGLSETELLDHDGQPLPRARWSSLFLGAEQSLTSRGGLIGFFHDYPRQAVGKSRVNVAVLKRMVQALFLELASGIPLRTDASITDRSTIPSPYPLPRGEREHRTVIDASVLTRQSLNQNQMLDTGC